MKLVFIILCFILCIISFTLYSITPLNWKIINTVIIYRPENLSSNNAYTTSFEQQIPTFSNRRFVIFACSIHSKTQAYIFYTPIIAASWKRVGYETVVVFVGDFTLPNILTSRLNLSRNYLKHLGAFVIDIQCNSSYSIKLSQLVRVFAGFLPNSIVHDDDDIITGDSDLMPLRATEYLPTKGKDGFIFNAFCCGSFKRRERSYRMFPSEFSFFFKHLSESLLERKSSSLR